MLIYINPIEILQLQDQPLAELDNAAIKKAKRRLFADIDLSDDGQLAYHGRSLSKNECESAIDQLDDANLMVYYHYLARNADLNACLAEGDDKWYDNFRMDDIFAEPGFVRFVSPYLAPQMDRGLMRAYQEKNGVLAAKFAKAHTLLQPNDLEIAYRGLSRTLQNKVDETDRIKDKVKDESQAADQESFKATAKEIVGWFPHEVLNALPPFFQSQLNKAAASLNYLQIATWERFDSPEVPLLLQEQVLKIRIEGTDGPTYQANYDLIKKRHDQWLLEQQHAPTLKPWQELLTAVRGKMKTVEAKIDKPGDVLQEFKDKIDIQALNGLGTFADDVRVQLARSIRGTAIASWNSQDEIKPALAMVRLALQIVVPKDVKDGFQKDLEDLTKLEETHRGYLTCYFCETHAPVEGMGYKTTIYKETSRSYFPQRRVEFQYIEVTLPRCTSCKDTHENAGEWGVYVTVGAVALGVLIGFLAGDLAWLFGGGIGLGIGLLIGYLMKQNHLKKAGVKGTGDGSIRSHPLLAERMSQGWTLTRPTA